MMVILLRWRWSCWRQHKSLPRLMRAYIEELKLQYNWIQYMQTLQHTVHCTSTRPCYIIQYNSIYANRASHWRTIPCKGPFYCGQCASQCVKANIFNGMGSPPLYCAACAIQHPVHTVCVLWDGLQRPLHYMYYTLYYMHCVLCSVSRCIMGWPAKTSSLYHIPCYMHCMICAVCHGV